jgi:lipopolysaccharide export LptBFGC system permease protein LptF
MRIFTRYILREIIGYALLGGVLFTFILFMRYLLPILELFVRGVASPFDVLRLIGYLLPSFLSFTIPISQPIAKSPPCAPAVSVSSPSSASLASSPYLRGP